MMFTAIYFALKPEMDSTGSQQVTHGMQGFFGGCNGIIMGLRCLGGCNGIIWVISPTNMLVYASIVGI